jgi:hypothetical protein
MENGWRDAPDSQGTAPNVPALRSDLERQIEAAFDYRGHVTITLTNGERVLGYVYNHQFAHQKLPEPPFIEVFLAGSGERQKFTLDGIDAVALTGKDYAAVEPSSAAREAPEFPHS